MPLYAYKCKDCGAEADYIQKFSDPPMTVCEACGGRLDKQLAAAAFHLKGGGWYKDGYASAKPGSDKDAVAKSDKGKPDKGKSDKGKSDKGKSDKGKSSSGKSGSGAAKARKSA